MIKKISKALLSSFIAGQVICDNHIDQQIQYVHYLQYRANPKIEDRVCYSRLDRIKGILAAVFDGHGGDLVADYAAGNLSKALNERVKTNMRKGLSLKNVLQKSLSDAFDDVENGYKAIFMKNIDNIEYQRAGACALATIITEDFVVTANSGDCEGIIVGDHQGIKINNRHNAGQPNQQARLKKQFPDQKDIYKCIPGTNYCYVKGRLQPTRSLGDFYLKNSEFNFTNLAIFTGPYITHKPQVSSLDLPLKAKRLVLASDGMWDQLNDQQVDSISSDTQAALSVTTRLFQGAMKKILQRSNLKDQQLQKIQNRRNIHDDISIVVVDIQALRQQSRNERFF